MKNISAYVFGFLAFLPLALVAWLAFFSAIVQESDNRAARQLENDKRLMLKVPAINKKHPSVRECQLDDGGMECPYSKGGVREILAAQ